MKKYFVLNDIPRYPYQNLINEKHLCKNNYSLTHVFQLLVGYLFFVDVLHLLDFDTADMIPFDTKYFLLIN